MSHSWKKGVLKNCARFTGKHLCQSLFFDKVAGFRPFLQNTSGRLFLKIKVIQCYEFWNWACSIHLLQKEKKVFKQISAALTCRHKSGWLSIFRLVFFWETRLNKYFIKPDDLILSKVKSLLNECLNVRDSSRNSLYSFIWDVPLIAPVDARQHYTTCFQFSGKIYYY